MKGYTTSMFIEDVGYNYRLLCTGTITPDEFVGDVSANLADLEAGTQEV